MYKDELVKELYDNVLSVIFKKVDGSMRKMRCTLVPKYLPNQERPDQFNLGTITVWDMDERDWRRFRVDSVQTIIKEFESDFIKPIKTNSSIRAGITASWMKDVVKPDATMIRNAYDGLDTLIRATSTEVLYYLCYNDYAHSLAALYKAELSRRGTPYTSEIEAIIQEETAFYD
jgi:hypothetical protein